METKKTIKQPEKVEVSLPKILIAFVIFICIAYFSTCGGHEEFVNATTNFDTSDILGKVSWFELGRPSVYFQINGNTTDLYAFLPQTNSAKFRKNLAVGDSIVKYKDSEYMCIIKPDGRVIWCTFEK